MDLGTAAAHCEARLLVAAEKLLVAFPRALPGSLARRVGWKAWYPAGVCPQGTVKTGLPCGKGLKNDEERE